MKISALFFRRSWIRARSEKRVGEDCVDVLFLCVMENGIVSEEGKDLGGDSCYACGD